jgi:hypothetical protein
VAVSRDEKSYRNALVVWSGLAVLLPVVALGWVAREAMLRIEEKANAAVTRVEASVAAVSLNVARIEERSAQLRSDVDRCCSFVSSWDAGRRGRDPALPAERRRLRLAPASTGGDGG